MITVTLWSCGRASLDVLGRLPTVAREPHSGRVTSL